jgi:hypothetical protein
LSLGNGTMNLLLVAVHIFVVAQGGREEKYKRVNMNVCWVKQDWLSLLPMYFVLFFYVYSVNAGQLVPNIQHVVWFLEVKEVVSDAKSRVSTLCVKSPKKNIPKLVRKWNS